MLAGALPAGSTAEHMCVYKNKPYVLYNDAGSYHLKLGVFEAEGFRTIDTLSATMDHPGAMATGENGLYIAYTEGEMEAGELRLQRYDGSALQMLADRVDTGYLVSPSLAVLGQDVYIGYRDFGRGEQAVVKTYSGGGVRDLPATGVRVGGCKVRVAVSYTHLDVYKRQAMS